ncbi:hypothetical protein IQ250_20880 [Pseudanabaenaceae cyanobacterium LEGE 13415]|nr:hypothetical protein [Pseudanabaenaceae cyanobacterium LEGE 13415]
MTWTQLATISATQDWQYTPVISPDLGYVRLRFEAPGLPVWIAQADTTDPDDILIYDDRRFLTTAHAKILDLEAPPFFRSRSLAIRLPIFTTSRTVEIEVSSMPFISSGSPIATVVSAAVGNVITIAASTQTLTLLEPNPNRKKLIVINNSTATMYLAFGEAASPTNHTIAISNDGDGYELEGFTGIVSAMWTAANGQARITEFE